MILSFLTRSSVLSTWWETLQRTKRSTDVHAASLLGKHLIHKGATLPVGNGK
jgi:hypothetical protein